ESAKVIEDFVPRDPPQPSAKRIPREFLAKAADVRDHGLEHFLENVRDVLLAQVPAPAPVVHQRRVQRDQPLPGRGIVRLYSLQQASGRGVRGMGSTLASGRLAGTTHGTALAWSARQ